MPRVIFLILALFLSQSFGLENTRCGTVRFAENLKNPKKKMLAKAGCVPDNLYDVVETKQTTNFIIYYTKSGPHAIRTNEFIDSLASYLEQAYNLHKNTLGMKGISGARTTYQYRRNVPSGLYPIEIIDAGLLRDYEGEYATTFGLTFHPNYNRLKETEIIIENDFAYGADCSGNPSKLHFRSQGVDYYEEWKSILRATTFHELYHAFQSTYFNWAIYSTFWTEASATGVEEIGAPNVNDYINYLSSIPGKSMEYSEDMEEYGWATLYLFLYSQLGSRFDSAIWNYFSKYPTDRFGVQLARLVDSLQKKRDFNKNPEELFHEYAEQIFYSGSRAKNSPYKLFWEDMPNWPAWRVNTRIPSVLQLGTFDFIRAASEPVTDSVARKSSLQDGNSIVWVLSRLLEKDSIALEKPPVKPDDPDSVAIKFAAYPSPWNPRNPKTPAIHFKNLPKGSRGVEIRSANGALIARLKPEEGDSLSWKPEKIPAPGILYYRSLPHEKNKMLIVQY